MLNHFHNDLPDRHAGHATLLAQRDAIAAQLIFGGYGDVAQQAGQWPTLWLKGDGCPSDQPPAVQSFVLPQTDVQRVLLDGHVIGSRWSDEDADYCLLAGISPQNGAVSRADQTTSCLQQMERGLEAADMDFSYLVRTWFYLDHLLDWYSEFNAARTAFFEQKGVFERLIPASTGIGAGNIAGMALAAGALAIRKKHDGVRIEEVASPLQCPATAYRSSFSRAVEIALTGRRYLTISGTASIAPEGHTLYVGDHEKQIQLTLDVVEAILHSRRMKWQDTVRAVGYFCEMGDLSLFERICAQRGIPPLPILPVQATVCRDDLLFEMELDALATS